MFFVTPQATCLVYHVHFEMSTTFFKFFSFLITHSKMVNNSFIKTFISCISSLLCIHKRLPEHISTHSGEGGIWTLAPLLTTYSLSRGAPSASWVLLQTQNYSKQKTNHQFTSHDWWFITAERVGFEPTCPCGQTVFKTASLWPLRYLSVTCSFSLTFCSRFVNYFFEFFLFFLKSHFYSRNLTKIFKLSAANITNVKLNIL